MERKKVKVKIRVIENFPSVLLLALALKSSKRLSAQVEFCWWWKHRKKKNWTNILFFFQQFRIIFVFVSCIWCSSPICCMPSLTLVKVERKRLLDCLGYDKKREESHIMLQGIESVVEEIRARGEQKLRRFDKMKADLNEVSAQL